MKKFMKVSVMALFAMFALSTVVDAQGVKTHEFDKFIAVYPADFEPKIVWGDVDALIKAKITCSKLLSIPIVLHSRL